MTVRATTAGTSNGNSCSGPRERRRLPAACPGVQAHVFFVKTHSAPRSGTEGEGPASGTGCAPTPGRTDREAAGDPSASTPRPTVLALTAGAQHGTLTVKSEGRVVGAHAQPLPPRGGAPWQKGAERASSHRPPPLPPRERDPGTPGGAKRDRSREQRPLTPGREQGAWPSGKGHGSSEHRIRSAGSILVYSIDSGLRYWSQSGVPIPVWSIDPDLQH